VALEHTVLATKVSIAEAAVSDNALGRVLAVFELAADLLGCSASQRKCQMQCAFSSDFVVGQCV